MHFLKLCVGYPFLIEERAGQKYLVVAEEFVDQLTESLHMPDQSVRHYPMVLPPKPWTTPNDGGYVVISDLH